MGIELSIHEGGFDECLTVIEHAVHLYCRDVLAQRGELALLYGADLSFGVEHIYVYAVHAEETIGNGAAGVAGCGNEHIDLAALALLLQEVLQQSRHKACTDILECQRGAVKQFQRIDIVCHGNYGAIECQRVIHNLLQGISLHVFSEECVSNGIGYFLKRHLLDVVKEFLWQSLDILGHIETFILCQALYDSLLQCRNGGLFVG